MLYHAGMRRGRKPNTELSPHSRRPEALKFHLQDIMAKHDLTLTDVSQLTGIPLSTLSDMARGVIAVPGADHLVTLCRSFGVGVGDLLEVAP